MMEKLKIPETETPQQKSPPLRRIMEMIHKVVGSLVTEIKITFGLHR